MRTVEITSNRCIMEMELTTSVLNRKGDVHGGALVALADTAAGYGCYANLPDGAEGFTTVELKCNFTGAARGSKLVCEGTCRHRGRTTQVWDATVKDATTERVLAEFRCTQLIFYPGK